MPRDNRCMYMAHVFFMSLVVTVLGSVGMLVVQQPLLKTVGLVAVVSHLFSPYHFSLSVFSFPSPILLSLLSYLPLGILVSV